MAPLVIPASCSVDAGSWAEQAHVLDEAAHPDLTAAFHHLAATAAFASGGTADDEPNDSEHQNG